jgi:hypothetical protein
MTSNETEEFDEETEKMEKQIGMIQQGIKYGLGVAFAGALLCLVIMVPVAVMAGTSIEESDGLNPTALIIVSVVVPFAGIGVLGFGLYKLIPLYMRYRRTKRPQEEMFP